MSVVHLQPKPQWIARMYPPTGGQDHLGVGSVSSDRILPTLSPSINVLTVHPRYHSFYVFLLDEFWRRDLPRTRASWVQFFRPRELVLSLGTHFCDRPEHGDMPRAVGSQKTAALAARKYPEYDTTTNYIKNDLGGYGLYYRSVMAEVGLICPGGPGLPYEVDVPSEHGKEVAAAFREAVQSTDYSREFFDKDVCLIPTGVIQTYIRQACLCQLQVPTAPDRRFLLDVFLHHGLAADSRRQTFRLLLDIAAQGKGAPLSDDAFRQVLYFQAADSGITYTPSEAVVETFRLWRLFQAREYYAFALNAMFYHLCRWGLDERGDLRPLPLSSFWNHIDQALDLSPLARRLNVPDPTIGGKSSVTDLVHWLERLCDVGSEGFDAACRLDAPIHEHRLYNLALTHRTDASTLVGGMVTILALVFLRFSTVDRWHTGEWRISHMGADGRLSVDEFIRAFRQRVDKRATLHDLTRWLFEDYIILQHQLVANSKMPWNNTFRFHREGDRLRFFHLENGLGFSDSRFNALSTTIHELGLCADLRQDYHPLTPDGQRLLSEGDLQ